MTNVRYQHVLAVRNLCSSPKRNARPPLSSLVTLEEERNFDQKGAMFAPPSLVVQSPEKGLTVSRVVLPEQGNSTGLGMRLWNRTTGVFRQRPLEVHDDSGITILAWR